MCSIIQESNIKEAGEDFQILKMYPATQKGIIEEAEKLLKTDKGIQILKKAYPDKYPHVILYYYICLSKVIFVDNEKEVINTAEHFMKTHIWKNGEIKFIN